MSRNWFKQNALAFDQQLNSLLAGYADETLSARSFRLGDRDKRNDTWGRWRVMWVVVDLLFIYQDMLIQRKTGFRPAQGHCERAYQSEWLRMQLPPEYRDDPRIPDEFKPR